MEITEWIHIQGLPNTSVTMNLWFEKKKKKTVFINLASLTSKEILHRQAPLRANLVKLLKT
jgi:hypothetical protein